MSAALKPEVNERGETSIGSFYDKSTIEELVLAAKVCQRLGHVPELRIVQDSIDEPQGVELFVKDLPSMARTLARSIAQNNEHRS
jgi:hypothetical protein